MHLRVGTKVASRSQLLSRVYTPSALLTSSIAIVRTQHNLIYPQLSSTRAYATDPPPFDSGDRAANNPKQLRKSWFSKLFQDKKPATDSSWETRRSAADGSKEGYEPDAEWEALQRLSSLIRKVKSELASTDDIEALTEVEFDIKDAVSDLISKLAMHELPVVHTRLIEEAWKILYTPQIGRVQETDLKDLVDAKDVKRLHFDTEELKRLLRLIVRFDQRSDYHVVLGRKVYEALMREIPINNQAEAQEQFMLFVLLLSRNKADNEMLLAFDQLLQKLDSIDEGIAVALVSIINNITDPKIQEILVSRLCDIEALDIGAFNIVLQAAVEGGQRNVWSIYDKTLGNESYLLLPSLDTYELLFRYIVKGFEPERSEAFMKDVKDVMFSTRNDGVLIATYDVLQNQELYRSYLTACIVVDDKKAAEVIAALFESDGIRENLDPETWDVWAQWIAYSKFSVDEVVKVFDAMAEYGYRVTTATLNGVLRASQVSVQNGMATSQFCDDVFSLFKSYEAPIDNTSVSLRIRDRLYAGDVKAAIAAFKLGTKEGLTWNVKTDDMKALFMILESLASHTSAEFDASILVELYMAIRVYVNSVDYTTRLAVVKAFIYHGEIGTLQDFLNEEMGESYRFPPSSFPELYSALREAVLESNSSDAAWMLYECLHMHFIPDYNTYLASIKKFCDLDYPEAALELFRHVRLHTDTPPQRDMYSVILRGFSRRFYRSGIKEVLMCYKIDLNIEPDTELFNAILEASNTDLDAYYTYHIWQQMSFAATSRDSSSGLDRQPNTETFRLLMRMASLAGAGYADHLWDDFQYFANVPITLEVVKFYVVAHLQSGTRGKALNIAAVFMPRILERLEALKNQEENSWQSSESDSVSPFYSSSEKETTVTEIIELLYNYVTPKEKEIIQAWALKAYPEEFKKIRLWDFEAQKLELYDILPYAVPKVDAKTGALIDPSEAEKQAPFILQVETGQDLLTAQEQERHSNMEMEEVRRREKFANMNQKTEETEVREEDLIEVRRNGRT
ncbi:hypothetical protein BZA70DRAFT_313219 [Myxozyma melibiosi]|uniref:Uncharacterized protein n=1 Tax=Myxozyma melibiosi TaxID=54550 RepID=A0ABR1EY29_9ASCO